MMRALVLLLIPSAAAIGSHSLAPRVPPHNLRRHLQQGEDRSLAEFCYDCIWDGDVTCEARAQYLVREYGGITLEEARASILDDIRQGAVSISDDCAVDGTGKEQVSLDLAAFCGECLWQGMNFDCDSRVVFLGKNYALLEEEAKAGLLEKGECVDPDYVAPSIIITEEVKDPQRLSNGAVIAIVAIALCITAVLLCLIWLLATRRHKREKVEENSQDTAVPIGGNDSPEAIDDKEPHIGEEPPECEHVPVAAKKKKKRRKSKRRYSSDKTISFALAKPDPDGVTSYIYPETTIEEECNPADAGVGPPETKDPRKPPVSLLRKPRYSSKDHVKDQELLNENEDMENCGESKEAPDSTEDMELGESATNSQEDALEEMELNPTEDGIMPQKTGPEEEMVGQK